MTGSARGSGPNRGLERHVVVRRHHGRGLYTVMAGRCEWCALGPAAVTATGDSKHEGEERPCEDVFHRGRGHGRLAERHADEAELLEDAGEHGGQPRQTRQRHLDSHIRLKIETKGYGLAAHHFKSLWTRKTTFIVNEPK